jgi:hypothetical protein
MMIISWTYLCHFLHIIFIEDKEATVIKLLTSLELLGTSFILEFLFSGETEKVGKEGLGLMIILTNMKSLTSCSSINYRMRSSLSSKPDSHFQFI